MIGTIINIVTILIGGSVGLIFNTRIPDRVSKTVIAGIGLFTLGIGIQMFLQTQNALIALGSILIGGVLGEWWKIETRLSNLGKFLETRFTKNKDNDSNEHDHSSNRFIRGFLTSFRSNTLACFLTKALAIPLRILFVTQSILGRSYLSSRLSMKS